MIPAGDPTTARREFEHGGIDLVILDVRLQDDNDDKDTSGLTLAREMTRSVPKIMLTDFPTVDAARQAFRLRMDGLPAALDFVNKQVILAATDRWLEVLAGDKTSLPKQEETLTTEG